jgi:hypothetical protein
MSATARTVRQGCLSGIALIGADSAVQSGGSVSSPRPEPDGGGVAPAAVWF